MAPPEYVQIVGQEQPAPLPVAWLEGDVLGEYLQFLKEVEEAAAAPLTGVKWLEGDVLANFLRFLEEDEQVVGQEQPAPLPVAWLEGDVLAEYLQFLKEVEEAAAAPLTGVKWLEGDVLANFLQFLEEDGQVVHYGSDNSNSGSNDGDFMCEEDQDDEEEEMVRWSICCGTSRASRRSWRAQRPPPRCKINRHGLLRIKRC